MMHTYFLGIGGTLMGSLAQLAQELGHKVSGSDNALYPPMSDQLAQAKASEAAYQRDLEKSGYSAITTEIREAPPFYYAEPEHQQYLAKNPMGYCGIGGTGVKCSA